MSKFIAYIIQYDEGCGYTIDCGKALWELKAETYDEAIAEVYGGIFEKEEYEEMGISLNYDDLESIRLYEVSNETLLPIEKWYAQHEREKEDYKLAQKRKREQLEYERLKAIFE